MSDFKSKLPDFKELSSMTTKLFKGFKASVEEIVNDYKQKRGETSKSKTQQTKTKAAHGTTHAKTESAPSKKTEHHNEPVKKRTTKKAGHDDHSK